MRQPVTDRPDARFCRCRRVILSICCQTHTCFAGLRRSSGWNWQRNGWAACREQLWKATVLTSLVLLPKLSSLILSTSVFEWNIFTEFIEADMEIISPTTKRARRCSVVHHASDGFHNSPCHITRSLSAELIAICCSNLDLIDINSSISLVSREWHHGSQLASQFVLLGHATQNGVLRASEQALYTTLAKRPHIHTLRIERCNWISYPVPSSKIFQPSFFSTLLFWCCCFWASLSI